jgi:hypothetical protein
MRKIYQVCVVLAIALLTLTRWMATPVLADPAQTQSSPVTQQSYPSEQKPYQSQQQTQFPPQKPYAQTSQAGKQSNLEAQPKQSQPQASLVQKIQQLIDSFKS